MCILSFPKSDLPLSINNVGNTISALEMSIKNLLSLSMDGYRLFLIAGVIIVAKHYVILIKALVVATVEVVMIGD